MKWKMIIDENREEEILIYAHKETALTRAVIELAEGENSPLMGYRGKEFIPLKIEEILYFFVENNRIYAVTQGEKWQLKRRLYQLEPLLTGSFVKIHQSCIANLKQVARFDGSLAGTLRVVFKNGDVDYVSRRNLKTVKERLGL